MPHLCESLEEHVPEIIAEYQRLTDRSPWTDLPPVEWRNNLPALLHAMITATICGASHYTARELVVRCAAAHGEQRRCVGFDAATLLDEQYLLRTAIWKLLTSDTMAEGIENAASEILRVDSAISIATIASLVGFHREELEASRDWDELLHELVARWEQTTRTK